MLITIELEIDVLVQRFCLDWDGPCCMFLSSGFNQVGKA